MKKTAVSLLLVLGLSLAGTPALLAKEKAAAPTADAAKGKAPLHAVLSADPKGKAPVAAFSASDAAIYLVWTGDDLKKGDQVRAVWYIVDGGKTVVPNSKLFESTLVAKAPTSTGTSSITKPATGWPAGKWRVDLFVNTAKVESYKFTVK